MNSNIKSMSLDCKSKYSFGLGHVQNDICATIWFTYTMLFYKLSYDGDSYLFVVIGQIFDAIITIIVGLTFNCSLTNSEFFSLGKFKTWYIIGLAMISFSFPLCFSEISFFMPKSMVFSLYVLAICLSQTGWSFCHISHLSLINEVTTNADDRIWMTSYR